MAAVDEQHLIETLVKLIKIPSVSGSAAEVEIVADCAGRLRDLDLEVDHWPLDLPALRRTEGYPGEEVERPEAWGLVGTSTVRGTAGVDLGRTCGRGAARESRGLVERPLPAGDRRDHGHRAREL